jgi:hypothetical protein
MPKKIIAIDTQYANRVAKKLGLSYFPIKPFRELVQDGEDVDVIETMATLVEYWVDQNSPEEVATNTLNLRKIQNRLEMEGVYVIRCPSKPSPNTSSGFKHSDDQRLMITTMSRCFKLRPDFLVFVAGDADYAPMLWELRHEGIRTEVVADEESLALELKRVAYNCIDLCELLDNSETNEES